MKPAGHAELQVPVARDTLVFPFEGVPHLESSETRGTLILTEDPSNAKKNPLAMYCVHW